MNIPRTGYFARGAVGCSALLVRLVVGQTFWSLFFDARHCIARPMAQSSPDFSVSQRMSRRAVSRHRRGNWSGQAVADGKGRSRRTGMDTQFLPDVLDVRRCRLAANEQRGGDLAIRAPSRE